MTTPDGTQLLIEKLYSDISPAGGTTIVVPATDGLPLAYCNIDKGDAGKLCAAISGITSLTKSVAKTHGRGGIRQHTVEMDHGFLVLVANRAHGNSVAVLTDSDPNLEHIVYEVTRMVEQIGDGVTSPARFDPQRDGR